MAVYTHVTEAELAGFLERYDVGAITSFKGIAEGVENSNYLLATTEGRFILTLYEKRVAAQDLPYFLTLMGHLAERGVPSARPIADRDGKALQTLCGRPAALIEFLDGLSLAAPERAHVEKVGAALADIHLAGADFEMTRDNDLGLAGWQELAGRIDAWADDVEDGLAALIQDELRFLAENWPKGLPEGVIHADLFPDNVLFMGGRLSGLIDFYFACNDAHAYDLAVALNAWCFDAEHGYNETFAEALIEGYEETRALARAERRALDIMVRGAALRFLLTRLADWLNPAPDALVRAKDPRDYAARLRFWRSCGAGL